CDSIVTTNLTVKPKSYVTLDSSVCAGDFVIVGTSVYASTGNFSDTLTAANGCDSIVTLHLTVRPVKTNLLSISICQGDSIVVGTSVYRNTGIYVDILTGSNGCDSTVVTNLTVRNISAVMLNPVRCLGDSFIVGSSVYILSGTYIDTLVKSNGCDSIVTTTLTVIN